MFAYNSALITGASSGIGAALAVALARAGVTLHLGGRDLGRLEATAAACRDRGAVVHAQAIDVADAAAMAAWIAGAGPLDLVIAGAGIGHADDATVFATNLQGALNTMRPAMDAMRRQPPGPDGVRGRIAVIASIAAFVPIPNSAAYCASKAAIDTWTVANARSERAAGIRLTSVCPGFIRTPMTAGTTAPMPGLMSAERAAAIMLRGIARGKIRLAFPWWMATLTRIVGLLPPGLLGKLMPNSAEEKP